MENSVESELFEKKKKSWEFFLSCKSKSNFFDNDVGEEVVKEIYNDFLGLKVVKRWNK